MVIPNRRYGERVTVQIGTLTIGKVMCAMTPEEILKADMSWWEIYFSMITANTADVVEDVNQNHSQLQMSKVQWS